MFFARSVCPAWPPSCELADSFLGNRVDEGPLYVAHAVCRCSRLYILSPRARCVFPGPRYIAGVFKPPCESQAVCASHVPRFGAHTRRSHSTKSPIRMHAGTRKGPGALEGGDSSANFRARISRWGAKPSWSRSRPVTRRSLEARRVTDGRDRAWGLEKRVQTRHSVRRGSTPCGQGEDKGMSAPDDGTTQRGTSPRSRVAVLTPWAYIEATPAVAATHNTALALARRYGCSEYRNRRRPPPSAFRAWL